MPGSLEFFFFFFPFFFFFFSAELLPVSSRATSVLVPWLAGLGQDRDDPESCEGFGVALHAGAAAALLIGQRRVIAEELRSFDAAGRGGALSFCRRPLRVDARAADRAPFGGPPATAPGCSPGPARWSSATGARSRGTWRRRAADGLALGVAQAAALAPGVSRNGATLAAARWRGFSREHSNLLSRTVALPVIVGATILEGASAPSQGTDAPRGRRFGIGVAASFASTLASQGLIRLVERDRALWPYAAYRRRARAVVLVRLRRRRRRG